MSEMFDDTTNINDLIGSEEKLENKVLPEEIKLEPDLGKFNKIGRDYFQVELRREIDLLGSIKNSSRFYNLQLPQNLNELFIKLEEAPLYWVYETPLLAYLEEHTKNQLGTKSAIYDYKLIKDYFGKWVIARNEGQRKMLANSTISLLRKEGNSGVIMNMIMTAVLYAFEKSIQNPAKAVEEFKKVKDLPSVGKLVDKFKIELYYLLEVFSGFAYMTIYNYYDASNHFSEALRHNPYGMTAKFYLAYTYIKLQQNEIAGYLIKEIYSYDLYRLSYAVDNNSAGMFTYFLRNPITKNFFYYPVFAALTDTLVEKINETPTTDFEKFVELRVKLGKLERESAEEYISEEIKKSIQFLTKMTSDSEEAKQILFISAIPQMSEKFNKVIEDIIQLVHNKFHSAYKPNLDKYDEKIIDNRNIIEQFEKEIQTAKEELQVKLREAIAKFEKIALENITVVEHRLNNLHLEKEFDPNVSFQNSMTYNFIIALTVFLIGGFAGYSNNLTNGSYDFNSTMGDILLTGIKWSMLTFGIGFLIALIFSGFVILERSNQKQRLLQKISSHKNEKDRKIDYVKKEAAMKEKSIVDNFNDRIELHTATIEDLKKRKELDEESYKRDAEALIEPIRTNLKKIAES